MDRNRIIQLSEVGEALVAEADRLMAGSAIKTKDDLDALSVRLWRLGVRLGTRGHGHDNGEVLLRTAGALRPLRRGLDDWECLELGTWLGRYGRVLKARVSDAQRACKQRLGAA